MTLRWHGQSSNKPGRHNLSRSEKSESVLFFSRPLFGRYHLQMVLQITKHSIHLPSTTPSSCSFSKRKNPLLNGRYSTWRKFFSISKIKERRARLCFPHYRNWAWCVLQLSLTGVKHWAVLPLCSCRKLRWLLKSHFGKILPTTLAKIT